jgi:hypothetical protein
LLQGEGKGSFCVCLFACLFGWLMKLIGCHGEDLVGLWVWRLGRLKQV